MEKLPKIKDFKAPQNYFEELPDQIISRSQTGIWRTLIPYASAAVVIICFGIWFLNPFTPSSQNEELIALDEEVLLYIESNQWSAEDVLSLSDDPNAILDEIIQEELDPLLIEETEDTYTFWKWWKKHIA